MTKVCVKVGSGVSAPVFSDRIAQHLRQAEQQHQFREVYNRATKSEEVLVKDFVGKSMIFFACDESSLPEFPAQLVRTSVCRPLQKALGVGKDFNLLRTCWRQRNATRNSALKHLARGDRGLAGRHFPYYAWLRRRFGPVFAGIYADPLLSSPVREEPGRGETA